MGMGSLPCVCSALSCCHCASASPGPFSPHFSLPTPPTKESTACLFKSESPIKLWLCPGNCVLHALGEWASRRQWCPWGSGVGGLPPLSRSTLPPSWPTGQLWTLETGAELGSDCGWGNPRSRCGFTLPSASSSLDNGCLLLSLSPAHIRPCLCV